MDLVFALVEQDIKALVVATCRGGSDCFVIVVVGRVGSVPDKALSLVLVRHGRRIGRSVSYVGSNQSINQ